MNTLRPILAAALLCPLAPGAAHAFDRGQDLREATANNTDPDGAAPENTYLYTKPDETARGGIRGRIVGTAQPPSLVLATPAAEPEKVYKADPDPADPGAFSFQGLPPGRYDLIAVCGGDFYEGIALSRGENSLTPADLEKINTSLQKSEPYFPEKTIHRVEGQTGRGNQARMVATYSRAKGSLLTVTTYKGAYEREDHKRTFKLVILQDVGPGWQIVQTRNYHPAWAKPGTPLPKHHFSPALSKIRVAGEPKDIGDIHLP